MDSERLPSLAAVVFHQRSNIGIFVNERGHKTWHVYTMCDQAIGDMLVEHYQGTYLSYVKRWQLCAPAAYKFVDEAIPHLWGLDRLILEKYREMKALTGSHGQRITDNNREKRLKLFKELRDLSHIRRYSKMPLSGYLYKPALPKPRPLPEDHVYSFDPSNYHRALREGL